MSTPAPLLVTRKQAADLLGCDERHIDRLREAGHLDERRLGTRIRITYKSLAEYVAALPAEVRTP